MSLEKLTMSFDPHTIEHLGVKMYSNIPNAIAELVANAYDADAEEVKINLINIDGEKSIEVIDNGIGMDFDDINNKFLRIGRKRRSEDGQTLSPSGKRKVTGKKGLGKLAFFGIGNTIEIKTIKEYSGKEIKFTLNWDDIISTEEKDYEPNYIIIDCDKNLKGTTIVLKQLKRKSDFDQEGLAISLSKLFNCFDISFQVYVLLNNENSILINNDLRYKNITAQFNWDFPSFSAFVSSDYSYKQSISGKIFATEKPLKPGLRGITLFATGRLVNAPEFFGVSESSHGFSYFTGYLIVDFIDDWPDDVISTDRQSLNWDMPLPEELREFLKKTMSEIEKDWRKKRNEERKNSITTKTNVNITSWYNTLPDSIKNNLEPIINSIIDKSELTNEEQSSVVQNLHMLVPDYPYYHYRHLHPLVQGSSYAYYQTQNYYTAVLESTKKYISEVRKKSGSTNSSDRSMMGEVFSNRKLSTTKKYKKTDGTTFSMETITNIEEGQQQLSEGMITGCRNPISHEEIIELKDSGLFSENDCLDALALLSHLFRRLEDSVKI